MNPHTGFSETLKPADCYTGTKSRSTSINVVGELHYGLPGLNTMRSPISISNGRRAFWLSVVLSVATVGQILAQSKITSTEAMYIEAGGKGFLYGLFYEHLLNDGFGVSCGLSVLPANLDFQDGTQPTVGKSSDTSLVILPIFVSWYPVGVRHRLFVDAGIDFFLLHKGSMMTGVLGLIGFGYNYRPREDGFYIKAGPMLMLGFGGERLLRIHVLPWFGVAVGKVF